MPIAATMKVPISGSRKPPVSAWVKPVFGEVVISSGRRYWIPLTSM